MAYRYPRLVVLCLSVACGDGGGGEPDAGPRADARPAPSCPSAVLPVGWTKDLGLLPVGLGFDSDGTLVVPGVAGEGDEQCAGLIRLAGDGTELWLHPYDPSPPPAENYSPCPLLWDAIALAPNGAILTISDDVSGTPPGATDIIVRKHDGDGDALWTYYNQNAPDDLEGPDRAGDVAVDPDGFIVAAGTVGARPWVSRFAPNGTPDWIWSGSESGEIAVDVEVAEDGTAFVGIATGPEPTLNRIARFDSDGGETTIAELTQAFRPTITPDGGLVFLVNSTPPRLRKIGATGATVWEHSLEFGATDEACRHVEVFLFASSGTEMGPDGSIYAAMRGSADTSEPDFPSSIDYFVLVRFSADGELLSRHVYQADAFSFTDLAIGPEGQIAMRIGDRVIFVPALDGGP